MNRRRLSDTRDAVTHRFTVGGVKVYISFGLYDDGTPGEIFIKAAKEGSTMRGLLDTIGILTSLCLQYGVPLEDLCRKLTNVQFEPDGPTSNKEMPRATSIVDYIFRWMGQRFIKEHIHGLAER